MAENILEMLDFARETALEAGNLLLGFHKKHKRFYKGSRDDLIKELVTEADIASDELIRKRIKARFPGHAIISEEDTDYETGSEYKWVVDPLDGTYPFSHRHINHWGVCIGLCRNLVPIVGVVNAPERVELYVASIEGDAQCNGDLIRTSDVTELKGTFIGFDAAVKTDEDADLARNVWKQVRFTHAAGCASIPMCLVASGIIPGGYIAPKLKPWDMAAAVIINRQAGNIVTNKFGKDWRLGDESIVIANTMLHPQLMELFPKRRNQ